MTAIYVCGPRKFRDKLEHALKEAGVPRDRRLPGAGTVLNGSYRGQAIVVKVLEEGFGYTGRSYASLSTIASQVTGTRWNRLARRSC